MLGVDTEVRAARPATAGWGGTEQLDAFADVVADFAARPPASVAGLLRSWTPPMDVENGLAPAEVTVAHDRVQILTVHAAKGLEWQVVAVPHLSGRVFPSTASMRTWLTDAADLPPLLRGDRATRVRTRCAGARHLRCQRPKAAVGQDFRPQAPPRPAPDRRGTTAAVRGAHPRRGHAAAVRSPLGRRRGQAPRPVGVPPRTQGHHRQPLRPPEMPCGVVEQWAPAPADGEPNPLRDKVVEAVWPADPAGSRRGDVDRGAELVAQAMAAGCAATATMTTTAGPPTSTRCSPSGPGRAAAGAARCPPSYR